jgi:hypothetical protein
MTADAKSVARIVLVLEAEPAGLVAKLTRILDQMKRLQMRPLSIVTTEDIGSLDMPFVGWTPRGGRWHAVAAGNSEESVSNAAVGLGELVVLPRGTRP